MAEGGGREGRIRKVERRQYERVAQSSGSTSAAHSSVVDVESHETSNWETLCFVSVHLMRLSSARMWILAAGAVSLVLLAKATSLVNPLILRNLVDLLGLAVGDSQPQEMHAIARLVVAYSALRFSNVFLNEIRAYVWQFCSLSWTRKFSVSVFDHLHELPLSYHLSRKTGVVLRVMDRGVASLSTLLQVFVFTIGPTFLELGATCVIFWRLHSATIALVVFTSCVSYALFSVLITQWRVKFRRVLNDTDNEVSALATDSLINFETVKHFANERVEVKKYEHLLEKYQEASISSQASLGALNAGQALIINLSICMSLLYAAKATRDGQFTVGDFVMVNTYILQLYQPLAWLGTAYRQIQTAFTDLEKMIQLLSITNEVPDAPGAPEFVFKGGHIVFEDVSFDYGGAETGSISNVSFEVKPGKSLALVGTTGSGKTTCLRLLFRFYDVKQGRILVDGQDISKVQQHSYRIHLGVVAQDTVLFHDSMRVNVEYGRIGASEEEVAEAIRVAQLSDLVANLPDGLETQVGERGVRLSGGEKQRVGIARMVLKQPGILMLDEATSALDTQTERAIQSELQKAAEGRTTVMVAHRLSTIKHADEILVLEKGRIVERGTHADLLEKNGLYCGLWDDQQKTFIQDPVEDVTE
ncbi:ATP-binding cassette sub-family B member 6, mitochondrial [Porphyridium purpureum]|uniref:Probable ATP-dependent transporter ycf16 n=1 Tax=Porphyridium purpureum TaxID=35688 RepID=A0A5J4Z8S0_PORPP|nr:ATP-binding cassette sub-family B member 6, mitochondrial [Porphyridium purpureum]|eukprot:POR3140..scf295_1